MNQIYLLSSTLTTITLLGSYFSARYGHHTKRFKWSEYFAMLIAPSICTIILAQIYGPKIWQMFLASAIVGTVAEYSVGLMYHKTLNKKLWSYSRMSIHGYTSILSIPFWAFAGLIFWFLGKILGI